MDDRRIEKDERRISLLLADGTSVDGTVYLSHHKSHDAAPEGAGELLESSCFIPVRRESGVILVNVEAVCQAIVPRSEELEETSEKLGLRYPVDARMIDGTSVVGELLVELPEEACRVKDYLNRSGRFFRMLLGDAVVYLNRRYVLSVLDEGN